MAVYRIYFVYDDGRLQPDESFHCQTDEEAVGKLHPPSRADIRSELWQGGRLIAVASALRGRPSAVIAAHQP